MCIRLYAYSVCIFCVREHTECLCNYADVCSCVVCVCVPHWWMPPRHSTLDLLANSVSSQPFKSSQ